MADQTAANASGQMPAGYRPPARSSSTAPPPPPGSQRPKGGTGGKRYVRTQAGASRYGKPIGTEIIAAPRDQRGAKAQSDKESTDRYKALVSGNPDQQSAAMKGLNDDQLKRLSEVAFSFQSSDPNVARLRAGVSLEMQRRSLDVNRYGGLGGRGGSKQGNQHAASVPVGPGVEVINYSTGERYRVNTQAEKKAGAKAQTASNADERMALHEALMAERKRLSEAKKAAAAKLAAQKKAATAANQKQRQQQKLAQTQARNRARFGQNPNVNQVVKLANIGPVARQKAAAKGQAMPGGGYPIRNVGDLRNAITAFGRAKPGDQAKVARLICRRAKELNAEHMLGSGIREAAGYKQPVGLSAMVEPEVVELAGKYRHGWILIGGSKDTGGGSGKKSRADALAAQGLSGSTQITRKGGPAVAGSGRIHTRARTRGAGKATAADLRQAGMGKKEAGRSASFMSTEQVPGAAAGKRPAANPVDKVAARVDKAVHAHLGNADYSPLTGLRAKLNMAGMSRDAQDAHLKRMSKQGQILLAPNSDRKNLTAADHAAAIHIGGEPNHLVKSTQGAKPGAPHKHKQASGSAPTAKQRYAAKAPDRIKHPTLAGGVYRRNSSGTYDLHINGRKVRRTSDLGRSRQDIATAARSVNQTSKRIGFSPEAAKTNLRNQGPYVKPASNSVQKSIARHRRKSGQ